MKIDIDWQFLVIASFSVTGVIQWLKGIVRDAKNPWSYIAPFLCFGIAFLVNGGYQSMIMNTVLILSISQLGYDVLVKPVKRLLGVQEIIPEQSISKIEPLGVAPGMSEGFADINTVLKEDPNTLSK